MTLIEHRLSCRRLEQQLNTALHQAGIYSMNITIFDIDEVIDNLGYCLFVVDKTNNDRMSFVKRFRHVYHLPRMFLRNINGTWLNSPLILNVELTTIFLAHQMERVTRRVYYLSKCHSFFYDNRPSNKDREYLQTWTLLLHKQQSNIIFDNDE
jgi:hypothetical protein